MTKDPRTSEAMVECDHGVTFDEEAAKRILDEAPPAKDAVDFIVGPVNQTGEIRNRWPRGHFTHERPCPKCGFVGIAYASYAHYLYGDW